MGPESTTISYDYPLNERIRTLLRLEDLFAKVRFFAAQTQELDHHAALLSLFEIVEVACRADLKTDLLQELERQKQILEGLRDHPNISVEALDEVLQNIARTITSLYEISGKVGQHMRDNEWLMGIKQRTAIPGGVCEFDLPSYHFWLQQGEEARRQDLTTWLTPMLPIYDGLSIILRMLRDSAKASPQMASNGTFQQMLSGRAAQLVRISLNREMPCVPELSANKYAINIRFTTLGNVQRPKLCEIDVPFDLTLCNL